MTGYRCMGIGLRVAGVFCFLAMTAGIVSGCFLDELNDVGDADESSSTTGDSGEIVTLTGSVMAASGESGGTSALIRTETGFTVATAPVEATPVQVFTVEGDYLGETETDDSGEFTLEAGLEDLRGADDTGAQWSEAIVVVAPDLGLENLFEADVEEGITEDIEIGETNPETTFATESITADISDFSGWGFPYGEHFAGRDIACLDLVHERLWESVDAEDTASIGGRIALMNEVLQGFMAAGGRTEGFYLPAYSDLMRAMMDGSITERDGRWEGIVAVAREGDDDLDTESALDLYADGAGEDFAEVRSVLADATEDATLSALVRALTTTTGSSADFCDIVSGETNAGSGEDTAAALIGMVTAAENASALDTTFGAEDGIVTLLGLMDNCAMNGNCPDVSERRTAFFGYFNAFGGDYGEIYVPGAGFADPALFDVIHAAAGGCTGVEREEFISCGKAMQGTVTAGGIDAFLFPDGIHVNSDVLNAWSGYWSGQENFNPANASPVFYQEAFTTLHVPFKGDTGYAFSQCLNTAGGSAASCYTQAGVPLYDSFTNYVASGGSLCGNATCNSGETSATCPADCPVAPVCGDLTCSGGETSSSCPSDCPMAAFCGDLTCNQGESNANCPADCLPPPPPQWTQVVANGFGQVQNKNIFKMLAAGGGAMFAGTTRTTGIAQLYKTTDGATWTQVTNFSPALSAATIGFMDMEYDSGTGRVYVSTQSANTVGLLYESTNNGALFTHINSTGQGYAQAGNVQVKGITVYGTKLYFSTKNAAGAQVWRSNVTPPYAWGKVLDFNDDDNDVISDNDVALATIMDVFGGRLYQAVQDSVLGAQVYNSVTGDQNSWTKNAGVGDGFGTPNNKKITSMQVINSYLYAGTENTATGAQLWRTSDGVTWTQTVNNGAGNPANVMFRALTVGPGLSVWMTTVNAGGAMVLRSTDGVNFQPMNTPGFGDANNISGTPDLALFQGYMFWGGENLVTGGQIWKVAP